MNTLKIVRSKTVYLLLTAFVLVATLGPAPLSAGVGSGTVFAGADVAGYGYGLESHNKRFQESEYYAFALKGEYVPFAFSDYAIGLEPYFGFGVGDVNINPMVMGSLVVHVMRKGLFDPFVKLGAGAARVSELQNLKDSDGLLREYTVSKGFFQMVGGAGFNLWFGRFALSFSGHYSFLERDNFAGNFGFVYKLRTLRKKK